MDEENGPDHASGDGTGGGPAGSRVEGAAGQQARASRLFAPRCFTCVLRAGNPMRLEPGRLAGLVGDNLVCGAGADLPHDPLRATAPSTGNGLTSVRCSDEASLMPMANRPPRSSSYQPLQTTNRHPIRTAAGVSCVTRSDRLII